MSQDNTPREGRFFWSLLCAGLGGLAFLAGILAPNHYLPWLSFHNEAPVFLALVLLCLSASLNRRWVTPAWPVAGALSVPILVVSAQWAFGQIYFFGDALLSILFLSGAALAWWLGVHLAIQPSAAVRDKLLVQTAAWFVVAATVSGFIAVIQWLGLEYRFGIFAVERPPYSRPSSNLAQPNLLATLVVIGTAFSLFLIARRVFKPWQAFALLAFFAFVLIATESRQGLLAAACLTLFLLCHRKSVQSLQWRYVAWWWASLLMVWALWSPLNDALLLQAPREMHLRLDSVRVVLWRQAVAAITQSPWLGYGWRQTAVAQKVGAQTVPSDVTTDYAHNVILDLLCWIGIPLGLALTVLVAWWLVVVVRRLRGETQVWLFVVTIPVFVHSMLEFPFAYAFFLFPLAGFLGALHGLQSPSSYTTRPRKNWVALSSIGGFAVVCSAVFAEYMLVEEDMRVMRFELRNVGSRPVDYSAPHLRLLTQMGAMLELGRAQPSDEMLPSELTRWREANLALSWATLHLKYVVALAINDREVEAERELQILKSLYGPITYRQAQGQLQHLRETRFPDLPKSLGQ